MILRGMSQSPGPGLFAESNALLTVDELKGATRCFGELLAEMLYDPGAAWLLGSAKKSDCLFCQLTKAIDDKNNMPDQSIYIVVHDLNLAPAAPNRLVHCPLPHLPRLVPRGEGNRPLQVQRPLQALHRQPVRLSNQHHVRVLQTYELEPLAGLTRDNVLTIVRKIDEVIEENEQRPVVYDIVEEIRKWIHEYLVTGKAYQTEEEKKEVKQEVFERPKFASFTPVTVENFNNWKKEFEEKRKAEKENTKKDVGEIKPTGKEWFLGKHDEIAESEEDEDQEGEESEGEEGEKLQGPRPEEIENELFD